MLPIYVQKEFLLNGAPVSVLAGNEFAGVSLRQKLLDGSSNPALIPATNQEVVSCSPSDCIGTTNQGNVAKVLQKIVSAKKLS